MIRDSLRNEMSKRSKTEEENREKREQLVSETNITVAKITIRFCSYSGLDVDFLHVFLLTAAVLRNLLTFKHRQPPQN